MDLVEMLRAVEAPRELIEWAPVEVLEGFETCPSGSWLVWLAGASGFPLDQLFQRTAGFVEDVIEEHGELDGLDLLFDALDIAYDAVEGKETVEECLAVAEECEALAKEPPATYRGVPPPGFADLFLAAAWVARAAEGLVAARHRFEAPRLEYAQHMGALLGVGSHIFVPPAQTLALDASKVPADPVHSALVYVVATLAEAADRAERSLSAVRGAESDQALRAAREWAADRIRASRPPGGSTTAP